MTMTMTRYARLQPARRTPAEWGRRLVRATLRAWLRLQARLDRPRRQRALIGELLYLRQELQRTETRALEAELVAQCHRDPATRHRAEQLRLQILEQVLRMRHRFNSLRRQLRDLEAA